MVDGDGGGCPRCGCPVRELCPVEPGHRMSQGRLTYLRCVCGSWLVRLDGTVVAATRSPR
ncbi:hypothetical protein [Amycolatopsis arida]|uniref:hypothetical protein n=1 Tax=Amycolatopsis arida TaxID=587909 RepID=UPI000B87D03E|nr:hypothetical protein [Amycolatopsis arida]